VTVCKPFNQLDSRKNIKSTEEKLAHYNASQSDNLHQKETEEVNKLQNFPTEASPAIFFFPESL